MIFKKLPVHRRGDFAALVTVEDHLVDDTNGLAWRQQYVCCGPPAPYPHPLPDLLLWLEREFPELDEWETRGHGQWIGRGEGLPHVLLFQAKDQGSYLFLRISLEVLERSRDPEMIFYLWFEHLSGEAFGS